MEKLQKSYKVANKVSTLELYEFVTVELILVICYVWQFADYGHNADFKILMWAIFEYTFYFTTNAYLVLQLLIQYMLGLSLVNIISSICKY